MIKQFKLNFCNLEVMLLKKKNVQLILNDRKKSVNCHSCVVNIIVRKTKRVLINKIVKYFLTVKCLSSASSFEHESSMPVHAINIKQKKKKRKENQLTIYRRYCGCWLEEYS